MADSESRPDGVKKPLEDLIQFVAFWVTGFMAFSRFSVELTVMKKLGETGLNKALTVADRMLNHNVVVAQRTFYWASLVINVLLSYAGYRMLNILWYDEELQVVMIFGFVTAAYLIYRIIEIWGVRFIGREILRKEESLTEDYGPGDRFRGRDLVLVPGIHLLQGLLLYGMGGYLRTEYGTSAAYCWGLMLTGLVSMGYGAITLILSYKVVTWSLLGVGKWGESALGRLAKAVLVPALPNVDESNVGDMIPESLVEQLKAGDEWIDKAFVPSLIPTFIVLGIGWALIDLRYGVGLLFVFLGCMLVATALMLFGGEPAERVKKTRVSVLYLLMSYAIAGTVANGATFILMGWHAIPTGNIVQATVLEPLETITDNMLISIFFGLAAIPLVRFLWKYESTDKWMALNRIGALFIVFLLVASTVLGWEYWTGTQRVFRSHYFDRFQVMDDEASHCRNGKKDGDEVFVDHGPSCGRYRQVAQATQTFPDGHSEIVWVPNDAYSGLPPTVTATRVVPEGNIFTRATGWIRSVLRWSRGGNARAQPATHQSLATSSEDKAPVQVHATRSVTISSVTDPRCMPNAGDNRPYTQEIHRIACQHGILPEIVHAIVWHESRYNAGVCNTQTSRSYCGLMQIGQPEAEAVGISWDQVQSNPSAGLEAGVRLLRRKLDRHGNMITALRTYAGGDGALGVRSSSNRASGWPFVSELRSRCASRGGCGVF